MNTIYPLQFPGRKLSAYSLLMLIITASAQAETPTNYFVNANTGDDANDCLAVASPCKTISQAIIKASTGNEIIHIAAGIYKETVDISRNLELSGENARTTIIAPGTNSFQGINVSDNPSVSINNLTVSDTAGSGILSKGATTELRIENVRVLGHARYGLFILEGSLSLNKVEVSGNSEQGLHLNPGATDIYIANTTISGNGTVGDTNSAGIGSAAGPVTEIINSTIYANERLGLSMNSKFILVNTIVADHSLKNCVGVGTLSSSGNNLSDDSSCNFNQASDLNDTAPKLVALAFNGGTTRSHALLADSPAIDTGSNTACKADDQRGQRRPVDADEDGQAVCDIGAFEATVSTHYLPIKSKSGKVIVIPF